MLPARFKPRFVALQLLILLTGVVDLLGLAIFIPVLSAVSDHSLIEQSEYLSRLKALLNISRNEDFLFVIFLTALGFFILRSSFIILSHWIQSKFVFSLSEYVGVHTFKYYLNQNYETFKAIDSSRVVRELTISPQHYAKYLVMPLLLLSSEFTIMGFAVAGIAIYNLNVFILLACTVFPIAFLFNFLLKRRIRNYGIVQNELTPLLLENSMRGIHGFVDVKLRSRENSLLSDFMSTIRRLNRISIKMNVISLMPSKIFELTTVLGLFLIFTFSVYIAEPPGEVLPLIAVYAAAAYRMIPSLSRILPSLLSLDQFSYLFGVYSPALESEIGDLPHSHPRMDFQENIRLESVTYAFMDQTTPLFNNLSVEVEKGEILGLIGRSGSGKTTLVNILSGFLIPSKGRILIDGKVLEHEDLGSWMANLSYVQQAPYLERGSLASNIAFLDDEVKGDRLADAIKGASLTDLVADVDPSDFKIEEHGKNLSGGQKQRIIIARALYHNADVLILDEATAALDNETEEQINATVKNLRGRGITIIIIAHRISTLKYTDRILRLANGVIVEETTYSEVQ